jgi:hypothetical protein
MQNGHGKLTLKNNEKYEGDWKDNVRTGTGVATLADGTRYEGTWKADKRDGRGTAIYPDGDRYDGEWKDDKQNGQGTMTFANGTKHTGIWKDDTFVQEKKIDIADNIAGAAPPKLKVPAALKVIGITFEDSTGNKNHILDANETGDIKFTLSNQGKGDATELIIEIQDLNFTKGITYEAKKVFPSLAAGEQESIVIPVSSDIGLATGETNFRIQVHEGNGFDAGPFYIAFKTREFIKPRYAAATGDAKGQTGCIIGDCKNGSGTMIFEDGGKYKGDWKNSAIQGKGTMTWPDGRTYEGEWKNNKQNGDGMEITADGSKYIGNWADGVKDGKGTSVSSIGRRYQGYWKNDKQNGEGLMTWPSGQKYLGKWKDGIRSGSGVSIWATGEKYDGLWKDDKQNGFGTYYYTNKQVYEGEWKEGQINGYGTMTFNNGKKNSGVWKDGVFVKEVAYEHVEKPPKPVLPAVLEIANAAFSDSGGNNNNLLDAGEKAELKFTLSNQGKGGAYNLVIEIQDMNAVKGIAYDTWHTYARLPSKKEIAMVIPITGSSDLETGESNFRIKITEANGYDSYPVFIDFKTQGKATFSGNAKP